MTLDPERADLLQEIEILPLVSAAVAFKTPAPVQAFGCLIAPSEKRRALGVLLNGCIFPGRGRTETWILGGAANPEIVEKSDEEIIETIVEERRTVLGAQGSDIEGYRITRWPKALPHYTIELERNLPGLQGLRNGVILIGNYLGDIGLARILERASRLPDEINEGLKEALP
jgi:protoporphyrinogen oxidase